jgi:AcrR family transcriptional regulator
MSTSGKRGYRSSLRTEGAEATRTAILAAARGLFSRHGIDPVTIEQIAKKAGVSGSTIYALFKSKEGLLRELMRAALFGAKFREAQALLEGVSDPVRLVALTAQVARAIYESESSELGLLRGASGFSPALRKLEEEFEAIRFDMQVQRLKALKASGKLRPSLSFAEARRIMWMYTSRDVYRMLVETGGWSADRYQAWLSETLIAALTGEVA